MDEEMKQDLQATAAAACKTVMEEMAHSSPTSSSADTKMGNVAVQAPKFNWDASDKLSKFETFKLECENAFEMASPSYTEAKKVSVVKNWLGRDGIKLVDGLAEADKDRCKTYKGLCEVLAEQFHPFHCETTSTLQFQHMKHEAGEEVETFMARLRQKTVECNFVDRLNRRLKEQFIFGINDETMLS